MYWADYVQNMGVATTQAPVGQAPQKPSSNVGPPGGPFGPKYNIFKIFRVKHERDWHFTYNVISWWDDYYNILRLITNLEIAIKTLK